MQGFTTDANYWGDWIIHDKGGCPCVGEIIHMVTNKAGFVRTGTGWTIGNYGCEHIGIAVDNPMWSASGLSGFFVVKYRVRAQSDGSTIQEVAEKVYRERELEDA